MGVIVYTKVLVLLLLIILARFIKKKSFFQTFSQNKMFLIQKRKKSQLRLE